MSGVLHWLEASKKKGRHTMRRPSGASDCGRHCLVSGNKGEQNLSLRVPASKQPPHSAVRLDAWRTRSYRCVLQKSRRAVFVPCFRSSRGLACSDKIIHPVDPARQGEHLDRLALGGIDVIVTGLINALRSKVTVKDGRVQQSNFDTFSIPRMPEVPPIKSC
jgi:hypothetical protein